MKEAQNLINIVFTWVTPKKYFLILAVLGFLVFGQSLFQGFIADDQGQIVQNLYIRSLTNIPLFFQGSTFNSGGNLIGIYYKPILLSAFTLIGSIYGPNPFVFHLVEIIFHILNAFLVFLIFRRVIGKGVAILGSLIFLVHPLNVEPVVYVSTLQDVLLMFFGLLSLFFISKIDGTKEITIKLGKSAEIILPKTPTLLVLGFVTLLCSMLSKETGILFVPIILLFVILFNKKYIASYLGVGGLASLIYLILRFGVAHMSLNKSSIVPIMDAPLSDRVINIPAIAYYYLKNFFYPKTIIFDQSWVISQVGFKDFYYPLIFDAFVLLIVVGVSVWIWFRNKALIKPYLFFLAWFIVSLSLHLQIYPLDATVADRWFYLPMIGLIGLVSVVFLTLIKEKPKTNLLVLGVLVLIITAFSIRSFVRVGDWSTGINLISHDLTLTPYPDTLQEGFYGYELMIANRFSDAIPHLQKTVQIYPKSQTAWNNLGNAYLRIGKVDEAKSAYQKSIDIGNFSLAYENMAELKTHYENPKSAIDFIDNALILYKYDSRLYYYLTLAKYMAGDRNGALSAAQMNLELSGTQEAFTIYSALKNGQKLQISW